MTGKRKAISKRVRFEVFKRDGFKCQYCGASAPDVLLQVDHIHPVSQDGDHDMMNFITSCQPCNAGKSDRILSDDSAVVKQRTQMDELHERREQLELLLQWREGMRDIQAERLEVALAAWNKAAPGWRLTKDAQKDLGKLVKKYGIEHVLNAIETAADTYVRLDASGKTTAESFDLAWQKLGGICALQAMPQDERRLYYVRAILYNRLAYVPRSAIDDMKRALRDGTSVDDMEAEAKLCGSWTRFKNWLEA